MKSTRRISSSPSLSLCPQDIGRRARRISAIPDDLTDPPITSPSHHHPLPPLGPLSRLPSPLAIALTRIRLSSRVISGVGRHLSTGSILKESDIRSPEESDGEQGSRTMGRMLLLMSLLTRFAVAEVLLGDVDEPRK